jgi:hypothetical protein
MFVCRGGAGYGVSGWNREYGGNNVLSLCCKMSVVQTGGVGPTGIGVGMATNV